MNNKLTKILLATSAVISFGSLQAKAADVVVAVEPEPVEYVRVCDAYGAGYFYIPGTETCMRVSGYVRADAQMGDDVYEILPKERKTYGLNSRATLRFNTATETDLGQLSTFFELRSEFGDGDDGASGALRFGYIQLGGLRVGIDESAFNQFTGYYGAMINDDVIRAGGYRTNLIQYTYAADNGFSAMISFEQGNSGDVLLGHFDDENKLVESNVIEDYVPHVVVGAKWQQGWGSIAGVVGYDSNSEEVTGKLRLDVNVSDNVTLWGQVAYSTAEDLQEDFFHSYYGDFAAWAGASVGFSETTTGNLQLSYMKDAFYVAANVAVELAPGLTLTPELNYVDYDVDNLTGTSGFGGALRLQRSF